MLVGVKMMSSSTPQQKAGLVLKRLIQERYSSQEEFALDYVWRISAVLNKQQKSVIVSDPLYAPVLPASPTSTRGLTQPRIFFRYLQDFGNPIV